MDKINTGETIIIAGAGYAGLRVAQRLGSWLEGRRDVECLLVDQHDYHQLLTELPRVAAGSRSEAEVRVPLDAVLSPSVKHVRALITGFDLPGQTLLTEAGPLPYTRLVVALGSQPNDFGIPGIAEWAVPLYSADDARRLWQAVNASIRKAGAERDPRRQRRLMTVVIGGAGATGVEFAGEIAERLPVLARKYGAKSDFSRVILVEAGRSILPGSSRELVKKAVRALLDLKVEIRTNAAIAEATSAGFGLAYGDVIPGGVLVWAGGVQAPSLIRDSGLPVGPGGRVRVDPFLQVTTHPEVFVAGDTALLADPRTRRPLPTLAQAALDEGDAVAGNLQAAIQGQALKPFRFFNKGFALSVGHRRGSVELPGGVTVGGRLAHALKDGIEWDYRQSLRYRPSRQPGRHTLEHGMS